MLTIETTFIPTSCYSAVDKAKFARHFIRFVEGGCRWTMFPNWFYHQLSNTFGHIAHYDKSGFFSTWFSTPDQELEFIDHCLRWPCHGHAEFTFCDVERVLIAWLRVSGIRHKLAAECADLKRERDLRELARLKRIYETA